MSRLIPLHGRTRHHVGQSAGAVNCAIDDIVVIIALVVVRGRVVGADGGRNRQVVAYITVQIVVLRCRRLLEQALHYSSWHAMRKPRKWRSNLSLTENIKGNVIVFPGIHSCACML